MTSSILEVVASARSKRFNIFVIIIALCLAIALSGDRAAATPLGTRVYLNSCTIYAYSMNFQSDSSGVVNYEIPIYLSIGLGDCVNGDYISGVTVLSSSFKNSFYFSAAGSNLTSYYFEPAIENGISIQRYNESYPALILDNFQYTTSAVYVGSIKGQFKGSVGQNVVSVVGGSGTTVTVGQTFFYKSSSNYGVYEAVLQAINDSSDVNSIITILDGIRNYTALLNSILDYLSQNRTLTEIYNQLVTSNNTQSAIYQEIYNYIHDNNSGAQSASQAAGAAATQAADQAAAEASLAALSPGNMADLDSALNDFDLLDTVQQSTTFWTFCVNQFSTRSGALWGIFVFGLIIGLIAFILRLRR